MNKICIILGTRPEIIKFSPIIYECQRKGLDFFIIHTNQHYSREMDKIFFDDLRLSHPKYNLEVGSSMYGSMVGRMLIGLEPILLEESPDIVLVQGDVNSALAGALTASMLNIPIGHIEAGLRSYDRQMPEETNRVIIDHVSDFLFVPTKGAAENLLKENIDKKRIFLVGNTIIDAMFYHLEIAKKYSSILEKLNLSYKEYALLTVHRPSNTDKIDNLISIFKGLDRLQDIGIEKIIFLAHPRVKKKIKEYKIEMPKNIILIDPVGYLDMLILMKNSRIIFTDSGGIQEESCVLNVPCITLRENTERPETLVVGGNRLVGSDQNKIFNSTKEMLDKEIKWENPFGNGKSAKKIINILNKL